MADTFTINGTYKVLPAPASPTNAPAVSVALSATTSVTRKAVIPVTLGSDAPEAVAMGDIANARVIIVHTSGKVKVAVTSADGAAQAFPVDALLVLMCASVPITAITLTRVAGISTDVQIVLVE